MVQPAMAKHTQKLANTQTLVQICDVQIYPIRLCGSGPSILPDSVALDCGRFNRRAEAYISTHFGVAILVPYRSSELLYMKRRVHLGYIQFASATDTYTCFRNGRTLSTMLGVRMHLYTTVILLLILPLVLSLFCILYALWYSGN